MGLFDHSSNDNTTCPMPRPLVADASEKFAGDYTFHKFNMILSGACTAATCLVILIVMIKHSLRFTNPEQQLKIMRIAALLPVYSIIAFISICFPNVYVYLIGWVEVIQGIALYTFLMLLCDFLAPNDRNRIIFFTSLRIPTRTDKTKTTDGLTWLQQTWYLVLQYPIIALIVAIAQCITEAANVYCLESNKRYFAHLWLNIIQVISVGVAVMSILRFYTNLKSHITEHKPLTKLFAFKMVIGLVFLEKIIFMILHSTDALKETSTLTYADVYIGLPTMIICIQMVPFAFFFLYAYSTKPYRVNSGRQGLSNAQEYLVVEEIEAGRTHKSHQRQGGPLGIYAWLAFFNALEFFREITSTHSMLREGRMRAADPIQSQESYRMQYGS
ncbi:Transmembrane protein 184C [Penicillium rolfsii]|nr:Transmembrane protein 184C [Penicillium rolfsii]